MHSPAHFFARSHILPVENMLLEVISWNHQEALLLLYYYILIMIHERQQFWPWDFGLIFFVFRQQSTQVHLCHFLKYFLATLDRQSIWVSYATITINSNH